MCQLNVRVAGWGVQNLWVFDFEGYFQQKLRAVVYGGRGRKKLWIVCFEGQRPEEIVNLQGKFLTKISLVTFGGRGMKEVRILDFQGGVLKKLLRKTWVVSFQKFEGRDMQNSWMGGL